MLLGLRTLLPESVLAVPARWAVREALVDNWLHQSFTKTHTTLNVMTRMHQCHASPAISLHAPVNVELDDDVDPVRSFWTRRTGGYAACGLTRQTEADSVLD